MRNYTVQNQNIRLNADAQRLNDFSMFAYP